MEEREREKKSKGGSVSLKGKKGGQITRRKTERSNGGRNGRLSRRELMKGERGKKGSLLGQNRSPCVMGGCRHKGEKEEGRRDRLQFSAR